MRLRLDQLSFGPWQRILSTLVYVFGFGLVALTLHEFFHLAALQALGGEGNITFGWGTGMTNFTQPPAHVWAVDLSGGLFTGVFLLVVFWTGARSPRSTENPGLAVGAFVWAIGNLAYAPVEVVTSSPTAAVIAIGAGFTVAAMAYFVSLMDWIAVPQTR